MPLTIYLWVNAAFYVLFSAWCVAAQERTAAFIGLIPANPGGRAEYVAVYGGLQAGLALFYILAACMGEHRRAALVFSVCLYGGIVLFRTAAAARLGFGNLGNAWYAYGLELTLLAVGAALLARGSR